MTTPAVLKGTRDFLPEQIAKRDYLFSTIRGVYQKFGFLPIETPAMEKSETLMGKYGEEGDRLIFRILNNGDFMAGADAEKGSAQLAKQISKRALRYDLTVPFARFVSQHRNELQFPFKRYQIQPVWRADRPQRGRYQEFFQCDADVVGSDALMHEIEFVQIFDEVLTQLGLDEISIHINNRKILAGLAEVAGCEDQLTDMAVALDKLDKIGEDKVKAEWSTRGLSDDSIAKLAPLFKLSGDTVLEDLRSILAKSSNGLKGIEELQEVIDVSKDLGLNKAKLKINLTLARGLDYYTGAIFEVTTEDLAIGSICGGGRYDDLTGVFGLADMSGVGISFGADRIYDVLEATGKWPKSLSNAPQLMFINFGEEEARHCLRLATQLRKADIAVEVYPTSAKMKKQMKFANDRKFPFVAMLGSEEIKTGEVSIKNMADGTQSTVKWDALDEFFKQ